MKDEVFKALSDNRETLYVFIGNELRGDDGAGPYIAANIRNNKIRFINACNGFENAIGDIIELKPKRIIVIDAAFFDGRTGEVRIIDERELRDYKMVSTHTLPLNIFFDLIRNEIKDVEIIIIGICAKSIDVGEEICDEVKRTCDEIIDCLNSLNRH